MYEAHTFTAEEEQALLQEWFETVHFDEESEGIPELDPERDDEGRSVTESTEEHRENDISNVEFEVLMAELRKRDPENPF